MEEEITFRSRRSNVLATRGIVATSQPLAAQAGLEILRSGGNAADAAVATAAMLNVVEPISTGVGGDCFVLHWDAGTRSVTSLNGSGWAPADASVEELRGLGYEMMPSFTGHTVTIPGAVAAWSALLERHGSMSLADVLQPAIWTAENGYPVTELIARGWQTQVEKLLRAPDWDSGDRDNGPHQPSGQELLIEGRAPRPGEIMQIPTLGETLRGIASDGQDYLYRGVFAREASEYLQRYGGWMTPEDLASYNCSWVEPIGASYRGAVLYECPPNSQGLLTILAANVAKGFELGMMEEADRVHVMIESMRAAFVHGSRWICDPRMTEIPLDELVSDDFADRLRESIDLCRTAGEPPAVDGPIPQGDTVYISAVDDKGNACSFINSLFMGTGTGLVVPGTGVSLQNRGALFTLDPEHPNTLAPGKRPYHTLMPGLIVRDGELYASFGVMGGHMQAQGHFQMLVNLVDLGLSPQAALDGQRWRLAGEAEALVPSAPFRLLVEEGGEGTLKDLARRGHSVEPVTGLERSAFGAGQIILRNPATGVLTAGSDPRKDGCAAGW